MSTIKDLFTSGTTHTPPQPGPMAIAEHETAMPNDVVDVLWPWQPVRWDVTCGEAPRRSWFPTLAEAEADAHGVPVPGPPHDHPGQARRGDGLMAGITATRPYLYRSLIANGWQFSSIQGGGGVFRIEVAGDRLAVQMKRGMACELRENTGLLVRFVAEVPDSVVVAAAGSLMADRLGVVWP